MVGQVNAEYESWDPRIAKYITLVKQRLANFSAWKLEHVPRDCNERVDALAVVVASLLITETIFLPIYHQPDSSIYISQYINIGELPNKKDKAHKVRVQSSIFSLIDRQLFKRSLDGSYLKCLTTE